MARDLFFESLLWMSGWNLWAGLLLFPALLLVPRSVFPRAEHRWILAAAGFCLFFGLKYAQHCLFQNRAFDLGLYTNVVWNLSTGGSYWDSVTGMNDLGDHFSPYLALLAPFMSVFPSDLTLSALQSAGLVAGLFPVYRLARRRMGTAWSLAACALYLFHPRLHGVHFYDFHIIAFAVPWFLWLLAALEEGRWGGVLLLGFLSLGIREDVSLAVLGIGAHVALTQRGHRRHGFLLMAGAVLWMLFVQKFAMPHFLGDATQSRNLTFFFSYLGTNFSEALQALLSRPGTILREVLSDPVRCRGAALYLLSFGFLPLVRPKLACLWIVPVAVYFLSDYYNMNQFRFQYSALSFPFLFYVSLAASAPLLRPVPGEHAQILAAACIAYSLLFLPAYFRADRLEHVGALRRLVRLVPDMAPVSAETNLVPRLARREKIHMFPHVPGGTQYVALDTASPVLDPEDLRRGADFAAAFHERIVFGEAGVYLLKSGNP